MGRAALDMLDQHWLNIAQVNGRQGKHMGRYTVFNRELKSYQSVRIKEHALT